jgi:hypothetical protein
MTLWQGLKRWYRRRFLGFVAAPPCSGGTAWQQHKEKQFKCRCGWPGPGIDYKFDEEDYVIRAQAHFESCEGVTDISNGMPAKGSSRILDLRPCNCPVTDARYIKICPQCHLGHWRRAI